MPAQNKNSRTRRARPAAPSARISGSGPQDKQGKKLPRVGFHCHVPLDVRSGIDVLHWMAVTAAGGDVEVIRGGKSETYDEAARKFLAEFSVATAKMQLQKHLESPGQRHWEWRQFWLAPDLAERIKRLAEQLGEAQGRVYAMIITLFIKETVRPEWRQFCLQTAQRADKLMAGRSQRSS